MIKQQFTALLAALAFSTPLLADEHAHGEVSIARKFIREILADNAIYSKVNSSKFFQELTKGQHPYATVVTCSDSRVQSPLLDKTPEGHLFMVRDIGNQIATAKGSVVYGVNHLASSLLLIVGHSRCGAITAASGDYSMLEPAIQKELDSINISKGEDNIAGVKINVNNQVSAAMEEFGDKVREGHLLILGAVFDFANDMKLGAGKLNIINVNGEVDPEKVKMALSGKITETHHK